MLRVLVKPRTIKLKILLPFSLFFISLSYTYVYTNNQFTKSNYNLNSKEIEGIVTEKENNRYRVCGKECILVYSDSSLEIGDKIKAIGTIEKPRTNTNFNLFNYRNYLYSNNIYYVFYADNVEIIGTDAFYKFKSQILNYISDFKSQKYLKIFIMGDNSILDDNIKNSYRVNGISHLLSISGMHISLFALILYRLLKKVPFRRNIINIFLFFYVVLTGFKLSAIRSFFLFLTSKWLKPIPALITICSFMLLYNPYYIYNIGFIFSFVITFFLLLLRFQSKDYFGKIFGTSLLSFLVSIPILTSTNFEINLLSPILNVFFIPFVSIIVFPLTLLTIFIKCLDPILFFITELLENISLFCNSFNLNLILCKPNIYLIFLYYLIIIIIFYKFNYSKLLLIVVIMFIHYYLPRLENNPVLTILDVGQGDSILIELENQKEVILIDTGGNNYNEGDISKYTLIPYLKSRGIREIDYLILTHGDYDHMGESINLVNNFKVKRVIFNHNAYNDLELELIKILEMKDIRYDRKIENLKIGGYDFAFLNNSIYKNENDNSSVIYTKIKNTKLLLMGDAGIAVEKEIISKYNLSNIDILKVGHHGSDTSSSPSFINKVTPKTCLISVGKGNWYGHPKESVLETLHNCDLYRTCRHRQQKKT